MAHACNGLLFERFQGNPALRLLVPGLLDLAKVADADDLVHLEVSHLRLGPLLDLFPRG